MRPVRLELEGFGPYRDHTVVDFTGADLFALTGPTGSGKSSIIDAICFALYGSIPRYDDRRLVAPAISQGLPEALVRLVMTVGGSEYTAVRVVKRTKTGATTKEARLERGDEVLAGNEKELTADVERLLGLTYEHFTKCVVLPQGDFARFLQDKPDSRQKLLVELLDLGVYGRMASLAHDRSRDGERRATNATERLSSLGDATPDALATMIARRDALGALRKELEAELAALAALDSEVAAARTEASAAASQAAALDSVRVPDDVAELGARVKTAQAAVDAAELACTDLGAATVAVEAAQAALPSRHELEAFARDHEELGRQAALYTKGEGAVRAAVDREVAAVAEAELATAELAAATARLEALQVEHRAHTLRDHLVVGEPCPVCEQQVAVLPTGERPADLEAAEAARSAAADRAVGAVKSRGEAEAESRRVADRLEAVALAITDLTARLKGALPATEVAALLAQVAQTEADVVAARRAERDAGTARQSAAGALDQVRATEAAARRAFHETQSSVAALGAPAPLGIDLVAEWDALGAWAAAEGPARRAAAEAATRRAEALVSERAARRSAVEARCAAAGVDVAPNADLRDAVVAAHTSAGHAVEGIEAALAEAERLRVALGAAEQVRDVARELHRHLGSRGFEKWLLDEALATLVAAGTQTLLELSGGQYSFAIDDRGFAVVDHRNADQVRSARTLSGGETFLASLALALALADQLALMAGRGGARLESLFLDEGFGTLDPETLDTVASAVDDLGASGRMVGLISHVPELAERVPVRFVVTKHGNASSIARDDR